MGRFTVFKKMGGVLSLLLLMLVATQAKAQSSATTDDRWKGSDPTTLSSSTTFYLYNVGTGKFVIAGGGWGVQAMLMYQDFGAAFTMSKQNTSGLTSLYLIGSGAQTGNNSNVLGANYADVTSGQSWGNAEACFGVLFDATSTVSNDYARGMEFTRVETSGDTYTYYITEKLYKYQSSGWSGSYKLNKTVYIGAQKGVNINASSFTDDAEISTNEVTYTETKATQTDNKNFMWRFVTRDELKKVIQAENADNYGGLNANVSFLLTDPYFDRNRTDGKWKGTDKSTTSSETSTYRLNWLSSTNIEANTTGATTTSSPWNAAVYRKVTLNTAADGMYSFGMLDGIGTASQTFTVETEGWYTVQCKGLAQGNTASLFISANGSTVETPLKSVTGFTKTTTSSPNGANYSGLKNIATTLYNDADGTYTVSAMIYVSANSTVEVGIKKDAATKSSAYTTTSWGSRYYYYYYDTDIVAFDNFNLIYTGKEAPFLLDEDKTDGAYIDDEFGQSKNNNVTTYLHRTFTLNEWNSLVLPVSMTKTQVKQYFGEDTQVAQLHGLSTNHGDESGQHESEVNHCIDFKTISLDGEGTAIEGGQMYIVKPTKKGNDTYKVQSETVENCYNIGRHNYCGTKPSPTATFGTSEEYPNGKVQYVGTYVKLEANADGGTQEGSYVFSKGNMYHLSSSMAIKGFRGWLNDYTASAKGLTFSVGSFDDGQTTYIDGVTVRPTQAPAGVYTLNGQLVSRDGKTAGLAKGIYVVNGKKVVVK